MQAKFHSLRRNLGLHSLAAAIFSLALLPAQQGSSTQVAEAAGFPGSMSYGEDVQKPRLHAPLQHLSTGQTPAGLGATQVDAAKVEDAPKLHDSWASITDDGWSPADPAIAGGHEHVVVATNGSIRVTDKAGKLISQSTPLSFFSALGNTRGMSLYEPQLVRDPWGGTSRYVLTYNSRNTSGADRNYMYLAISKTEDPTQGWWLYAMDFTKVGNSSTTYMAGNPRLGMNSKSFFIVANMHRFSDGAFVYSKVRFLQNRKELQNGTAGPKWWDRTGLTYYGTSTKAMHMVPGINRTDSFNVGYPAYFAAAASGSGSYIYLWKAINTDDHQSGPIFSSRRVAVTPYENGPDAPQKGTNIKLRNLGARLGNAFVTNRTMYTVHAVKRVYGNTTVSALRYYELDMDSFALQNGQVSVDSEITFGGSSAHYIYPSVSPSGSGDVLIGFCASSPNIYPSLRFTGRRKFDTPDKLQSSALLKAGEAPYTRNASNGTVRWGEVTGITNNYEGKVHFVGPYARSNNSWGTWVGAFFKEPTLYPTQLSDTWGEGYAYMFGRYDDQRIQLIDRGPSGKGTMPYVGIAFRQDNRDHSKSISYGRTFDTTITVAESTRNSYTTSFSSNRDYNVKQVLNAKIDFPDLSYAAPAAPYRFSYEKWILFDAPYMFSGRSDRALVTEFLFQNGQFKNGKNFTIANYYLDAPAQQAVDEGPLTYYGSACYDRGLSSAHSAYVAPSLDVYAKEANTSLQNKVLISFSARTGPNTTALFAYGVQGYANGISIGACNNLHLNPIGIIVANTDGNGMTKVNLGYVAYNPLYAGGSLFMQAGWDDTRTGHLRLSRAGRRIIAQQPASPTLWAVQSSSVSSATGNVPTASPAYNPVRAYIH